MGDVHTSLLWAPVSEMTHTVCSGTLNSTIPYRLSVHHTVTSYLNEYTDRQTISSNFNLAIKVSTFDIYDYIVLVMGQFAIYNNRRRGMTFATRFYRRTALPP